MQNVFPSFFLVLYKEKKCVYLNYTRNNMQNCLLEVFQCAIHQSTPFPVLLPMLVTIPYS